MTLRRCGVSATGRPKNTPHEQLQLQLQLLLVLVLLVLLLLLQRLLPRSDRDRLLHPDRSRARHAAHEALTSDDECGSGLAVPHVATGRRRRRWRNGHSRPHPLQPTRTRQHQAILGRRRSDADKTSSQTCPVGCPEGMGLIGVLTRGRSSPHPEVLVTAVEPSPLCSLVCCHRDEQSKRWPPAASTKRARPAPR